MPPTLAADSPYANLTASQVLARQAELLASWAAEDTARLASRPAWLYGPGGAMHVIPEAKATPAGQLAPINCQHPVR